MADSIFGITDLISIKHSIKPVDRISSIENIIDVPPNSNQFTLYSKNINPYDFAVIYALSTSYGNMTGLSFSTPFIVPYGNIMSQVINYDSSSAIIYINFSLNVFKLTMSTGNVSHRIILRSLLIITFKFDV